MPGSDKAVRSTRTALSEHWAVESRRTGNHQPWKSEATTVPVSTWPVPTAAMGRGSASPEPSRRSTGSGSRTGPPSSRNARAGERPTQPNSSMSSPLRKRWHRTPPVARPLAGNAVKGVTSRTPAGVRRAAPRDRRPPRPRAMHRAEPHRVRSFREPMVTLPAPALAGGRLCREAEKLGVGGDEHQVSSRDQGWPHQPVATQRDDLEVVFCCDSRRPV